MPAVLLLIEPACVAHHASHGLIGVPESFFVGVYDSNKKSSQCMTLSGHRVDSFMFSYGPAIYYLKVHPSAGSWVGDLLMDDGKQTRSYSLGALSLNVGANVSISAGLEIDVVPTFHPKFLIASCMGRPDLTIGG